LNRIYELVRQIWKQEGIPEDWKETIIICIYKKGDTGRKGYITERNGRSS
jgi:hypothetical protein